ncbi:MAG: glycosyltransferase, partial [Clostridium perfringens]|nr:glycosyltransferase [Clostridium perfringens]
VIAQTYSNWELIIVDDCSSDRSCSIVEKFICKDNRIKLFKQAINKGPAEARNIGIKNAKGRYIAFLDSDDLWAFNKLEIQVRYMIDNKLIITCTSYEIVSQDLNKSYGKFIVPKKILYKDMLKKNYFSCNTVVIDRYGLNDILMESFEKHEDYVTWLKYIKQIGIGYGINEILSYYRIDNNTRSSNKKSNIVPLFKIYYKVENLGILKSIFYLLNYCFRAFIKYRKMFL